MGKIIIPGKHGIGTEGIIETYDGYREAARKLVDLHNEGYYVDTSHPENKRVLDRFNASSMDDLRTKVRGW